MFIHITVINSFDHNVGMACAKVRLRCTGILLVLIYFITVCIWYVPKLDSDDHSYYLSDVHHITGINLFDNNVGMACAKV